MASEAGVTGELPVCAFFCRAGHQNQISTPQIVFWAYRRPVNVTFLIPLHILLSTLHKLLWVSSFYSIFPSSTQQQWFLKVFSSSKYTVSPISPDTVLEFSEKEQQREKNKEAEKYKKCKQALSVSKRLQWKKGVLENNCKNIIYPFRFHTWLGIYWWCTL